MASVRDDARCVITTSPSTMAVPKSGWSMTRPIGTAASPMVTVKRQGFISPRCSLAYPASATTIPNFTSSDGWSWKPPGSWNQACEPRAFDPSGESTASRPTTVATYANAE